MTPPMADGGQPGGGMMADRPHDAGAVMTAAEAQLIRQVASPGR
jgi:hypothetical protein